MQTVPNLHHPQSPTSNCRCQTLSACTNLEANSVGDTTGRSYYIHRLDHYYGVIAGAAGLSYSDDKLTDGNIAGGHTTASCAALCSSIPSCTCYTKFGSGWYGVHALGVYIRGGEHG